MYDNIVIFRYARVIHPTSFLTGLILSAQTFTYTISKFFASWATDHYTVRYMFAGGMFMTGFVTLAFSGMEVLVVLFCDALCICCQDNSSTPTKS